jgi:putative SOS response-associated peptidase YedK
MCGRYANHLKNMSDWTDILGDWPAETALSMNIAPTQSIPVVIRQAGVSQSKSMRWGQSGKNLPFVAPAQTRKPA